MQRSKSIHPTATDNAARNIYICHKLIYEFSFYIFVVVFIFIFPFPLNPPRLRDC